jgi:hypothetical protein
MRAPHANQQVHRHHLEGRSRRNGSGGVRYMPRRRDRSKSHGKDEGERKGANTTRGVIRTRTFPEGAPYRLVCLNTASVQAPNRVRTIRSASLTCSLKNQLLILSCRAATNDLPITSSEPRASRNSDRIVNDRGKALVARDTAAAGPRGRDSASPKKIPQVMSPNETTGWEAGPTPKTSLMAYAIFHPAPA